MPLFAVTLDRVTGINKMCEYLFGGTFEFSKHITMGEAKKYVEEEMGKGYYNHASIYNQEDKSEIERVVGQPWRSTEYYTNWRRTLCMNRNSTPQNT